MAAINEVSTRVVYTLADVIILFYRIVVHFTVSNVKFFGPAGVLEEMIS